MADLAGLLRVNRDRESGFSIFVEDNGRVCYAYLKSPGDRIVGDVWLYNRCEAPLDPEWTDREGAPYANPAGFAHEVVPFELPREDADITFRWLKSEAHGVIAEVLVRGRIVGRLTPGSKPGWAVAARKDGPLAKVLREEPTSSESPTMNR